MIGGFIGGGIFGNEELTGVGMEAVGLAGSGGVRGVAGPGVEGRDESDADVPMTFS